MRLLEDSAQLVVGSAVPLRTMRVEALLERARGHVTHMVMRAHHAIEQMSFPRNELWYGDELDVSHVGPPMVTRLKSRPPEGAMKERGG